jgi:hypothetical protein
MPTTLPCPASHPTSLLRLQAIGEEVLMSEQGVSLQQVMQLAQTIGSDDSAFMHQMEALFMAPQVHPCSIMWWLHVCQLCVCVCVCVCGRGG